MLKESIEKAFNKQVNEELYSAYIYYSMSAYFESINLRGCASWMRVQAQEELGHVDKFYNFILDRGGRVEFDAIQKPPKEWDSPLAAFESALEHEKHITQCINDLVELSLSEKDHAAYQFLQWFVEEQVEEEANVGEVVDNFKLVGDGGGIFMLDRELGRRTLPDSSST